MKEKKLKLDTLNIQSFVTKKDQVKGGVPGPGTVDYSNTFTTSSTDKIHGCTYISGCPCDSFEAHCLDMP